jgi:hypothetical protein
MLGGGLSNIKFIARSEASDESGMELYLRSLVYSFRRHLYTCCTPLSNIVAMAEVEIQQPSISVADMETESTDKDALVTRLDELLEKYLHTLDEYQKTREQLSMQLSSVRRIP